VGTELIWNFKNKLIKECQSCRESSKICDQCKFADVAHHLDKKEGIFEHSFLEENKEKTIIPSDQRSEIASSFETQDPPFSVVSVLSILLTFFY